MPRDAGENPDTPDTTREAAYAKQDKTWVLNSTVAGRIYLAPESKQPPESTQLYVNFGYAVQSCQKIPEWIDALSPACSKELYEETMGKLVAYLKTNKPSATCCLFDSGSGGLKVELTKILEESGWSGATQLIEVEDQHELLPTIGTVPGYDQAGLPFTQDLSYKKRKGFKKSKIDSYRTAPCWEPVGLNVVVTLPGTVAQENWPKVPQAPVMAPVAVSVSR